MWCCAVVCDIYIHVWGGAGEGQSVCASYAGMCPARVLVGLGGVEGSKGQLGSGKGRGTWTRETGTGMAEIMKDRGWMCANMGTATGQRIRYGCWASFCCSGARSWRARTELPSSWKREYGAAKQNTRHRGTEPHGTWAGG
jgi:hypothetical protein